MDDESRDVSLRLSAILEKVGVSERMRQLRRDVVIREEIVYTIVFNMMDMICSLYRFGSSIEGTTTPGMNSDQDMVVCIEYFPVVDHILQAPRGQFSLLEVTDSHTRPGYVKLQLVHDGTPVHDWCLDDHTLQHDGTPSYNWRPDDHMFRLDNMGRVCVRSAMIREFSYRSGPADTFRFLGSKEIDMVMAVRSRTFPSIAMESLLECTRSGWLRTDDVEKLIQYGCLYVGAGHPSSDEKEYEWRISFSHQERQLMFRLNPTQHKCYVLLKFIKNMLTSKPNIGESITSYHCKTCLFRVITKTRPQQWTPQKLVCCTLNCLTELLQCLRNGNCPNFFIKANNMFERRVYGEVTERLIHYISGMLNEGCRLFYRIESDNIGKVLSGNMIQSIAIEIHLRATTLDLYRNTVDGLAGANLHIVNYANFYANEETTRYLFQQLCYLSSINTITEHTRDETEGAIRDLEPILHKIYAAHLASLAFSTDVHESKHRLLQASIHYAKRSMNSELMSGRLLYVSILFRQGNIDTCSILLEGIEHSLHDAALSACSCYPKQEYLSAYKVIRILSRNPDPQSFRETSVAVCMFFLPSHSEIIPTALQYEMYLSVAAQPESQEDDEYELKLFDMAVVDSKVYLYFMQYLVYSCLNGPAARRTAVCNLLKLLHEDLYLGHRETGYNLLGWIYSQEGQVEDAAYCFIQSWKIRPHHNAAKWHMLILMYQHYIARVTC